MTRQEMFDKAVRGLKSQGFKRSMNDQGNRCAYNGKNGSHCAFGWLITDVDLTMIKVFSQWTQEPRADPNTVSAYELIGSSDLLKGRFGDDLQFVNELQLCHDEAYACNWDKCGAKVDNPMKMKDDLRNLAVKYNLAQTVLDEA